jgi:hypothetical protein
MTIGRTSRMSTLPASIDPAHAAEMLQHWGFLAHSDLPDREGPSYLLVAVRPHPTLAHYDPEEIEYWVNDRERGVPATLTKLTRLPLTTTTTWGMIRVTDRLRETNEWLTFGGTLEAQRIGDATIAVFKSPAPLLRRGGHSQGWDTGAANLGAFFAKVRGTAGYAPRFEAQAARAEPNARFACFVADFIRRYRRSEVLRNLDPELWRLLQREERRLRDRYPADWDAGNALLAAMDGASTGQLMGDFAAL